MMNASQIPLKTPLSKTPWIHPWMSGVLVFLAMLAVLATLLTLGLWIARTAVVRVAHEKADRLAARAAKSVTLGMHFTIPTVSPNASDDSLLSRVRIALQGDPEVLRIRKFRFEGTLPVTDFDTEPQLFGEGFEGRVWERLREGAQVVDEIGGNFFRAPDRLTGYSPVFGASGELTGAIAIDVNPVALRARMDLLRALTLVLCALALGIAAWCGRKVWKLVERASPSAKALAEAQKLEALTIDALGEVLYRFSATHGNFSWLGTPPPTLVSSLTEFPETLDGWMNWIFPEDLPAFRLAHEQALENQSRMALEYRILKPGSDRTPVWVLDRATLTSDATGAMILVGALVDISLRKNADALLREFMEQTPMAHVIFDGDEILTANPAAVQMFHAGSLERLQSSPLWTLWPKRQPDSGMSAHVWAEHMHQTIREGSTRFEWTFQQKDGQPLSLDVFLRAANILSRQVVIMACHDLSKAKKTQALLMESERRFRDVTEAVGEFVWEVDEQGHYIYASRRVQDILGVDPDEALGKHPFDWLLPEDFDQVLKQSREIVKSSNPFRDFVHRVRRSDGVVRWVSVSGVPRFNADGRVVGHRGITLDITPQREYEAELVLQKEAAETADRAKSDFLAMMSHEIRTPLNSVLGFADLLLQTNLTTYQREALETIRLSGDSLLHLLNDILDLSKIESDRLEVEITPTNIRVCLNETLELHRETARSKNIQLSANVSNEVPEWIASDPVRLKQILMNLVSNAVKFTLQGSVVVEVSMESTPLSPRLSRSGRADHRWLSVRVRDSGIGVRSEQRERLFKPFSQADSSTTRKFGGTGLGLVISRRLARLLGGDLMLEVTSEHGTTFRVDLPQDQQVSAPGDEKVRPSELKIRFVDPVPRILVVDDNPINRLLTTRMLDQLGVFSEPAVGGLDCLAKLAEKTFDAVLMDVQMPGVDGLDTTRRRRKIELESGSNPVPIIALTAGAMSGDREKCIDAGMNDYLSKPIRRDALIEVLQRVLPKEFVTQSEVSDGTAEL